MSNTTTTVMRELADGSGFSPCSASDENVGKRRCNHIPSSVKFTVQVNKIGPRVNDIVISDDYAKLDKRDKQQVVKKFVKSLAPIDKDTADNIISQLRDM